MYADGDNAPFVPTETKLFRTECLLSECLEAVYDRADGGELSAVSAGCSNGAEADSLLAVHDSSDYDGGLSVTGYDVNPLAIEKARAGQYFVLADYEKYRLSEEAKLALTALGFDCDFDNTHTFDAPVGTADFHKVESGSVREGHEVKFEVRDVSAGQPPATDVNLVLANNMLYHLEPEVATDVVNNLASLLSNNGVLSMGETPKSRYLWTPMGRGRYPGQKKMSLGDWLSETTANLEAEFGLQPIQYGRELKPTIFAKA